MMMKIKQNRTTKKKTRKKKEEKKMEEVKKWKQRLLVVDFRMFLFFFNIKMVDEKKRKVKSRNQLFDSVLFDVV